MPTALSTQYVKLSIGSVIHCIKDFPDIDPHGEPDQIEITTLCDEFHEYINGLKNYGDALEFTANYDEAKFGTLNVQPYDSTKTYAIGDLARENNRTLKCKTAIATAEAFDPTKWEDVAIDILLCDSQSDTTGKNGKFSISACDISVKLTGAGVGDALEMVIVIRPKSAITFTSVA